MFAPPDSAAAQERHATRREQGELAIELSAADRIAPLAGKRHGGREEPEREIGDRLVGRLNGKQFRGREPPTRSNDLGPQRPGDRPDHRRGRAALEPAASLHGGQDNDRKIGLRLAHRDEGCPQIAELADRIKDEEVRLRGERRRRDLAVGIDRLREGEPAPRLHAGWQRPQHGAHQWSPIVAAAFGRDRLTSRPNRPADDLGRFTLQARRLERGGVRRKGVGQQEIGTSA